MTRYTQTNEIERLKAEAHVADQVVEDLSRALEDSERVSDRYREALVHIDQIIALGARYAHVHEFETISKIIKDAMWTKVDR
jgi:hypothetical protein